MRKQLLALLSALGLAGSSIPASAQGPQGAASADVKTESKVKASKVVREDAASKDAAKMTKAATEQRRAAEAADDKRKISVSSVEGGHATSDVVSEKQLKTGSGNTFKKSKKSSAETHAVTITGRDKWKKAASENSAVSAELDNKGTRMAHGSVTKGLKTAGESNAVRKETTVKDSKVAAGANSAQSEAAKKANQAQPK